MRRHRAGHRSSQGRHRIGRNDLVNAFGEAINAILAAAGHNGLAHLAEAFVVPWCGTDVHQPDEVLERGKNPGPNPSQSEIAVSCVHRSMGTFRFGGRNATA